MSHVTCQMSCVMFHVSHVMCDNFNLFIYLRNIFVFFFSSSLDKVLELSDGGSVITGATLSSSCRLLDFSKSSSVLFESLREIANLL